MTTDEVLNLDEGKELLFVRGLRPIKAQKLPYMVSDHKDYADANPLAAEYVGRN